MAGGTIRYTSLTANPFVLKEIQVSYEKYNWLPESIIADAVRNRWETSLSYYLLLRRIYKNPVFYQFTYRKLSRQTGISSAVLNRHIKRLISKGLIHVHNGNLCLYGINKIKKDDRLVAIKTADNKKSTLLNIQFTRILDNLKQQHHVAVKKIEIIKLHKSTYTPFKEAKKLLKAEQKLFNKGTEKSVNDYYMLSNQKFGTLTNRSKSTGYKIQQRMNDAQLIHSERNTELYSHERFNKRAFYNLCLPACYVHSKSGLVYRSLPNRITLPCT